MTDRRDPSSSDQAKQLLLSYVQRIRNLRDERKAINDDIKEVKAEARASGYSPKRIQDVVEWLEECEKHGRDVVDEAEALFDLYRSVVDGKGLNLSELMDDARDRALLNQFAGDTEVKPKAPTRKQQSADDALRMADMNRMLRGDG